MPTPSVADERGIAHPSAAPDTPIAALDGPALSEFITLTIATARQFPSAELVDQVAALFPAIPSRAKAGRATKLHEGPNWYVSVSPGRVRVWTRDEADVDRRENNERGDRIKSADALATYLKKIDPETGDAQVDEHGQLVLVDDVATAIPERIPSRSITEWSSKSRRNMEGILSDLDFAPMFADPTRPAAMLTLTYPGCWLPVAPNGEAVGKHLKALRKRYERKFGEVLTCVWKKEFQGRTHRCECRHCADLDDGRAPHIHLLICPPRVDRDGQPVNFMRWISDTWADVVDHPDPEQQQRHRNSGTRVDYAEGMKANTPNRVVTYFAKHGDARAKEYQHRVPAAWQEPGNGPGRFWGYWGLQKKISTTPLEPEVGAEVGRVIRRYSRAMGVTRQVSRPRTRGGRPISKYPDVIGLAGAQLLAARDSVTTRKSRTRAIRAKNGRGWIRSNDGPRLAMHIAWAVRVRLEQRWADAQRAALAGQPDTPLSRALRLPPSAARDDLIRRLREKY